MSPLLRFEVATKPRCPVVIGPGALSEAAPLASRASQVFVVSDTTVAALHGSRLALDRVPRHLLTPGESAKRFAALEPLLEKMAEARLDRESTVIALGGGSVGDVAGLAAALYMRGIAVLQCPTTLLSMADAAIGGKTAIDLAAGKNLAGAFHQPCGVIADTNVLATLPESELVSGLGEVLKCALLAGESELAFVESHAAQLLARDADALARAIGFCARLKANIVAEDPREKGPRKLLNLGHTFAHAIEKVAGYGKIPHGVAVGCGLALACAASARAGLLVDKELVARVCAALARLGLCASIAELETRHACKLDRTALVDAMALDKKNRAGVIRLVLPIAVGDVLRDVRTSPQDLRELLA
jgi:3-dehydroquinate synthase